MDSYLIKNPNTILIQQRKYNRNGKTTGYLIQSHYFNFTL